MVSEMTWEELLHPVGDRHYELQLASGAHYRFQAERRIWDNLDIVPDSLETDNTSPCPLRFVVDARAEFGMSPATEATFLRELSNTLRQDLELERLYGDLDAKALINLPPARLHAILNGHPKAIANKGRLGWGESDLAAYAPEYGEPLQLFWVAARRDALRSGRTAGTVPEDVLTAVLGPDAEALHTAAGEAGATRDHVLLPVHPWQWDNVISQAFLAEISEGRVVPLGRFGPQFVATPSIRTLTPAEGGPYDVKLSLGILNTSAWRGMPGKYIEHGGAISDWLTGLVADDPVLAGRVTVLREALGYWYEHPVYADCPEAPYRHHEMLGAIWRDAAEHRTGSDRRAVLAAALFHEGACRTPLAAAYAEAAGMPIENWLAHLFDATVVPLWHILCRYGAAFIAHGQNVTVILDGHVPVGMAIKDFQGDLDLVDQDFSEMEGLDPDIRALLPRKPPAYIVHDIQTAHFVTVLRFLSAGLARSAALNERAFYDILSARLMRYAAEHPELKSRFEMFALFEDVMPKVCINRVRFAIGYEDSAERPLPARGTDLVNPLRRKQKEAAA
ncbi:IucA/IucC family protein [Pontivivens ytuae]|nr:IucA/IucC family protein [Pontivivens ytuae]